MLYVGVRYVLIHQNPNRDGREQGITMEIEENEIHFICDAWMLLASNGYHLFHFTSFLPSQASERAKEKRKTKPTREASGRSVRRIHFKVQTRPVHFTFD
jgi:hypothetical protein